MSIILTKQ